MKFESHMQNIYKVTFQPFATIFTDCSTVFRMEYLLKAYIFCFVYFLSCVLDFLKNTINLTPAGNRECNRSGIL
jgi:hypothetical protein